MNSGRVGFGSLPIQILLDALAFVIGVTSLVPHAFGALQQLQLHFSDRLQ